MYCGNDPVNYWDPLGLVDVIVTYIAEKNNGSVVYSEKNFFGIGGWDKKIAITIGETTKEYSIGKEDSKVKIVNGKSVMDSQILIDDFGLSETQATHQSGDEFDTDEHAAIAWGFSYNGISISNNTEYASAIYIDNGKYKYTDPLGGNNDSVSVPSAPSGKKLSSVIHAHGAYDARYDNENFSGKRGDEGVADYLEVPIYVTTPGGKIKKYDPNKIIFKTSVLNSEMQRDPNSR